MSLTRADIDHSDEKEASHKQEKMDRKEVMDHPEKTKDLKKTEIEMHEYEMTSIIVVPIAICTVIKYS